MKIAVLAGGKSPERDVSVRSGLMVAKALIRRGHKVSLIDPVREINHKGGKFLSSVEDLLSHSSVFDISPIPRDCIGITDSALNALSKSDKVFIALHGGDGENGNIQAILEMRGIKYNGSSPASCAASMDKLLTKKLFEGCGIPTLPYTYCENRYSKLPLPPSYPCVVKPSDGGSSIGISFVMRPFGLKEAVDKAVSLGGGAIIEPAVFGREFTVSVLNDRALAVTEIIPKTGFYDYDSKYEIGRCTEITPANLTKEQTKKAMQIALNAHKALGMGTFSRTDILMDTNSNIMFALEVNAIPGMTETSLFPQAAKSAGIDFDELCELML